MLCRFSNLVTKQTRNAGTKTFLRRVAPQSRSLASWNLQHAIYRRLSTDSNISFETRRGMKRKASEAKGASAKRRNEETTDYCDVSCQTDGDGRTVWPAPEAAMEDAREFLRSCAATAKKTLVVPDKDADGLTSGVIILKTLVLLGLPPEQVKVHLLGKNSTVHDEAERVAMAAEKPSFIIVVDQGSRRAPPVVDSEDVRSLIIDHHLSEEFPENTTVVSACHYPPVATSSLLVFEICKTLHAEVEANCGFLCAMGTHGDLGNTLKWKPPFPDMTQVFKAHTKKAINDAVALVNARARRTARFDVISAWNAILNAETPKDILSSARLLEARAEINEEVEIHTHTPPKFSKDGKIAVLRINTPSQVHGVIATRWAGYLNSKALEIIMVANSGYRPGYVNFSCRIARTARSRDPPVNIIDSLKAAAALDTGDLIERMGESFARGHKEASGGIVPAAEFEELISLMEIGVKPDPKSGEENKSKPKTIKASPQKNNLLNYFGKA